MILPILAFLAGAAQVPAAPADGTIFRCALGAKSASVSLQGGQFVYRYGSSGHPAFTLSGTRTNGRVHYFNGRYAGNETQLRFVNGPISYILYSMEGGGGAAATSGLIVLTGKKRLSDRQCRPTAEFTGGFEAMDALPQDGEQWSAMSVGG